MGLLQGALLLKIHICASIGFCGDIIVQLCLILPPPKAITAIQTIPDLAFLEPVGTVNPVTAT